MIKTPSKKTTLRDAKYKLYEEIGEKNSYLVNDNVAADISRFISKI